MNAATPKKRERPVIRVFVSSTFTDFKHERDAQHQKVFRKLRVEVRDGAPMETQQEGPWEHRDRQGPILGCES